MASARLITSLRGLRCTVTVFLDPELDIYVVSAMRASAGTYSRYYTTDRVDALTQASIEVKADNACYLKTSLKGDSLRSKGKHHVA